MKIPINQIKDIIYSVFSDEGYNVKNFSIQLPKLLDAKISLDNDNNFNLEFANNNLPKVSWKKIITFSGWIEKIMLGKTSGSLKLKYLPAINFSYDNEPELFGSTSQRFDFSDIERDIDNQYGDQERKKIAQRCLQYATEWTTIASQSGEDFTRCTPRKQRKLKNECREFVIDNFKRNNEFGASPILLFLLFFVVLPVVLRFVLEKLFKKLFS